MMRPILLAALLLCVGEAIAADNVRTGSAAKGGWRDDAPGVRRLVTPQDMPPPRPLCRSTNIARTTLVRIRTMDKVRIGQVNMGTTITG